MSTGIPGFLLNPLTRSLEFIGRHQKPGYVHVADKKVRVEASTTKPAYFIIGSRLQIVTSDLDCNFNLIGAGGLDEAALVANKAYYLYGILSGGQVKLVASIRDPESGPRGLGDWTYIGAFATDATVAKIIPFRSSSGFYMSDDELMSNSHTGDTSFTAQTYASMPVTVKQCWFQVSLDGTAPNNIARVVGETAWSVNSNAITLTHSVSGTDVWVGGWCPIFTAQTIYLKTGHANNTVTASLFGWKEAPNEYK